MSLLFPWPISAAVLLQLCLCCCSSAFLAWLLFRGTKSASFTLFFSPPSCTADQSRAEPTGLMFCSLERVKKTGSGLWPHTALVSLQPTCPKDLSCWMKSHLSPISFISSVCRMTGRGCVAACFISSFLIKCGSYTSSEDLPRLLSPSAFSVAFSTSRGYFFAQEKYWDGCSKRKAVGWVIPQLFPHTTVTELSLVQLFQGKFALQSGQETKLN